MEDAFVISCHPTAPDKRPSWSEGKDHPAKCSECQSLHPYEFIYQLLNGGFIRGWMWEGDKPLFCETDGGLFYCAHLTDMSEEWLLANAYAIFEHTGLVFYWEKEAPVWQSSYKGIRMGLGSATVLSEETHEWARALIADKFYQRRTL